MFSSADEGLENNERVQEDVKPKLKTENGADDMEDFPVDELDTEAMEALDAVEEKALKIEIKVSQVYVLLMRVFCLHAIMYFGKFFKQSIVKILKFTL